MEKSIWNNCYPSNWKGKIVPEAFQHPAKFSSRLIQRIYEHIAEEGWIQPGDVIVDPFGGIALGAMDAMRLGLAWRGVELEGHFADIGNQNIALWNQRFASMPKWSGDALLLQGDSRNLVEILAAGNVVVSSPPYTDSPLVSGIQGQDAGKLRVNRGQAYACISSPPFSDSLSADRVDPNERTMFAREHGISNAANVSVIDMEKIGKRNQGYAVVSSPPYADGCAHNGGNDSDPSHIKGGNLFGVGLTCALSSPPYAETRNAPGGSNLNDLFRNYTGDGNYGESSGQLGAMRSTDAGFQAAISSPPFLQSEGGTKASKGMDPDLIKRHSAGNNAAKSYGENIGQLTNGSADDFWFSARAIIEQVYEVLQPGGHAIWVVKDYVKNKQRVAFCDQWRELCEAVGFISLHEHHAMLVKHHGTSLNFEGEQVQHITESKSFFRRLAEKKGSPHIDWETVFCMEKGR
ncbi:MAG TPA: hypothetical protein DCG54_07545 [Anaerolineae bacterium]|jgi:hypothetical protein|nr:hypothetical protein [Anaerolineae bacterium]